MDWDKLRVFHAVASAGSLTHAGDALHLSQSAVSRQIRALEDSLGSTLFHRHARGLILTEQGELLFEATQAMVKRLDATAARIRDSENEVFGELRVTTTTGFGTLWLAPRLPALRAALPGVTVSLTALERLPDAKRAPYDLAVFFADSGGRVLEEDALMPVCAPALAQGVRRAEDLMRLPFLTDSSWSGDWRSWAAVAAPGLREPRGTAHSLYALAVDEALAGAGVLIGHRALLARHLAAGLLVAPLGPEVPTTRALRLFRLRPLARSSDAARVAVWFQSSTGAPPAAVPRAM